VVIFPQIKEEILWTPLRWNQWIKASLRKSKTDYQDIIEVDAYHLGETDLF